VRVLCQVNRGPVRRVIVGMTDFRGRVLGGVAVSGRIARLVLLACTLFGLAAMHTIGHGGVDHAGHHDEPLVAAVGSAFAAGEAASEGCECDHTATQPLGGSGMSGWGLCVAVLGALAVAVLLAALLLGAVTGRHPPRTARGPCRRAPRAPPVLPFGLTLATVSVLRT
jgi:hypothetical protein